MAWFTPYDHWLTMTIVATMQPFFALTYARAVERVAGTALGGIVAAAVGLLCTTPLAIALAMFPLTVAALAVRAVNFGLFMLALTPVVVLLVETGEPGYRRMAHRSGARRAYHRRRAVGGRRQFCLVAKQGTWTPCSRRT